MIDGVHVAQKALDLAGDCRRCKGTGTYGMMNGRGENYCYGCAGCGKSVPITTELVATIKTSTEAGDLAGYFAAESESRMRKVLAGRGVNADALAAGLVEVFAAIAAFVAARPAMPVRTTVNQWPNARGVEIEVCRNGVAVASAVESSVGSPASSSAVAGVLLAGASSLGMSSAAATLSSPSSP
jgi:hypothetical protein